MGFWGGGEAEGRDTPAERTGADAQDKLCPGGERVGPAVTESESVTERREPVAATPRSIVKVVHSTEGIACAARYLAGSWSLSGAWSYLQCCFTMSEALASVRGRAAPSGEQGKDKTLTREPAAEEPAHARPSIDDLDSEIVRKDPSALALSGQGAGSDVLTQSLAQSHPSLTPKCYSSRRHEHKSRSVFSPRLLFSKKTGRSKKTQRDHQVQPVTRRMTHDLHPIEREAVAELRDFLQVCFSELEAASHGAIDFHSEKCREHERGTMCDYTLKRFLVARGWDKEKSAHMLLEYFRWREANPVGCIDPGLVEASLKTGKVMMLSGRCYRERPVLLVVANRHVADKIPLEESCRFIQYAMDKIMHTALDDTKGIGRMNVIVDLRGVGAQNFDQNTLRHLVELMNNYFPERLGTAILWKPPTIFWFAWKLIKGFIPAQTRARLFFAYKPKDVQKVMDQSIIPAFLGGQAADEQALESLRDFNTPRLEPSESVAAEAEVEAS